GGLIPGDLPLPAEQQGLTDSDFVLVGRARVKIPRAGDWTIGVHSDEGFGLRFIGAPFDSVSGVGVRDDNFPEFMVAQNNTANSNTRGILKNIAVGTYEIEFISWERVGSAYYEVYAAEGAFANDADTDQWQLIGATGGLEIVAALPKITLLRLSKNNDQVPIDFPPSAPAGAQHQLHEISDLARWQAVTTASFQATGNNNVRATVNGVTGSPHFYRVFLPGP